MLELGSKALAFCSIHSHTPPEQCSQVLSSELCNLFQGLGLLGGGKGGLPGFFRA